jgi:alkylation response protein AidB-like acyl-CoA dehydrogenase
MDFAFSDEQRLIGRSARKLLERRGDLAPARAQLESGAPYDAGLWKAAVDSGWPATALPEDHGGEGLGLLELAVLAEELGRVVAPIPFSSTVYLAQSALLLAGQPALAADGRIGTAALWGTAEVSGGRLSGVMRPVPDGMAAQYAIVLAGGALYRAELDGVGREPLDALDPTRPQAALTFDATPCEPLDCDVEALRERAAVLFAFEQLGGAQRCLEMAVAYAKERYQFGRPIGSFQAVKHRLADMFVAIELARSNCYYGAWAVAEGASDASAAACGAHIGATEAYAFAAQENLHLHGGIGFTWDADPHLFLKRARSIELLLGSPAEWRERLMTHLEAA